MSDDLIKRLMILCSDTETELLAIEAADRIRQLEHELQWEKESREVAAEKSWKFSDRIRKLETALQEIASLGFWDGDSAMGIARAALEGKKDE